MTDILKKAAEVMGAGSWEQAYHILEPAQLPWNAGGPDPDLMRLAGEKKILPGRAVDLGTGPGHDAIFLAREGFSVLAVDISPTAVKLAAANAGLAGLADKIDFQAADALKLELAAGSVSFFNDRGFFHFLPADARPTYLKIVSEALAPGGLLLLRTFSDQEPPGVGPTRFSRAALESIFQHAFTVLEAAEGVFLGPQKPKSLLLLLGKR